MKKTITTSTVEVANIQALPDLVVGQASSLKQTFDKTGADTNEYINDVLIPELNGNNGANKIGLSNPELASDNVGDGIAEVLQVAKDAQAGTIIDGSIEDSKLSNASGQIKERVSDLETSVSDLIIDVSNIETDIDIITTAVQDTGTVNAIVVDTLGTFDLTKNGNVTPFIIPLFTNTSGTVNVNIDGQGNKLVKKANDTGVMVALEVGDIKKNVPCQLVWDSVNDFFIFAPKWGSNIKSIQTGEVTYNNKTSLDVTITSVDVNSSIVRFQQKNIEEFLSVATFNIELINSTTIRITSYVATTNDITINWEVVEFKNVKSKQSGASVIAISSTGNNVTISSVNQSKSIVFSSTRTNASSRNHSLVMSISKLTNSTNLNISRIASANEMRVAWQLIEFN